MKETKFKQTEVGMIPSDWEVKTISEIAENVGDGIHSTPAYSGLGTVFFINGNNIKDGKLILHNDTKKVDESVARNYSFPISKRTLLMSINGTIGNIAPYNNEPVILGKSAAYISVRRNYDRFFLMYMLQMDYVKQFFENSLTGSTIKNLGLSTIRETYIKIPPTIEEQQRIANALSDVDTLIANLEKLIAKKKNIKQGAMQQLLTGRKRLPGFAPAKPTYKQTELGMIPGDWEFEIFGKLVSIYRGGSPRPIEAYITTNPSGINWIKIGDVDEGAKYITSTQERIIPEGKSRSREVHKGDFILSNSMSFGRPYILKVDGCIHDGWLTIQDYQDTFDTDFLYYMLSSEVVFNQYVSMAAGSSVQNLNKEKVAAVKLFYPPSKTEQTAIANVLSDMDTEISALETKLAKYRTLKTGMMQQLLTGKIRLV